MDELQTSTRCHSWQTTSVNTRSHQRCSSLCGSVVSRRCFTFAGPAAIQHLFNNCLTPNVLNITSKLFFSSGVTAPFSSFYQFFFSIFFVIACNALVTLLAVSVVSYELMWLPIYFTFTDVLYFTHFCSFLAQFHNSPGYCFDT